MNSLTPNSLSNGKRGNILRWTYILLGFLCTGLGTLGIFIPLLPTTPFLLLAAYFFARSSARFHSWLLSNALFGRYLKNYLEKKGIPLRVKIMALLLLWLTISFATIYVVNNNWIRGVLIIILLAVTYHILTIKTITKR